MGSDGTAPKRGIREHSGQFALYVLLVLATGLAIGSEQTVVPLLGVAV